MNCAGGYRRERNPPFFWRPPDRHEQWSKRVNSSVCGAKTTECQTFSRISVMIGLTAWPLCLRLVMHSDCMDFLVVQNQINRHFCWIRGLRFPITWKECLLWKCARNNRAAGCFLSNRMGNFRLKIVFQAVKMGLLYELDHWVDTGGKQNRVSNGSVEMSWLLELGLIFVVNLDSWIFLTPSSDGLIAQSGIPRKLGYLNQLLSRITLGAISREQAPAGLADHWKSFIHHLSPLSQEFQRCSS